MIYILAAIFVIVLVVLIFQAAKGTSGPASVPSSVQDDSTKVTDAQVVYESGLVVVPFSPKTGGSVSDISSQMQEVIDGYESKGYKYQRMEHVQTYIPEDSGCFGMGRTPARMLTYNFLIFRKA